MAKVFDNIATEGLTGTVGRRLIFKRGKLGDTIVGTKPKFPTDRIFSEAQKLHQLAFRRASAYGRYAQGQDIYIMKAQGTRLSPYNVAMADWFHAPEILELDLGQWTGQPGRPIRILAVDDVLVKQVSVTITNASGAVLERGDAVLNSELWWEYTTTGTNTGILTVTAVAQDTPGHSAELSKSTA